MTNANTDEPQPVSLRQVWPNESLDFTPWLADNLHLLGDAIGMELSLIQTEASGWAGYLDVLAEATGKGKVAIENQIEPSDSDHFARLIGYAANHDARILIWVAPQFWMYHLRQVAWLNQVMAGNGEVHVVAARLVPDDDGNLRPVGNEGIGPGFHAEFAQVDLDKYGPEWAVLKDGDLTETNQRYRDFFQGLLDDLRRARFTDNDYVRVGNYQTFPSGFAGIDYHVGFWSGPSLDVYLWIATWDTDINKQIFDTLHEQRTKIKEELPGVGWGRRDSQRMSAIYLQNPGSISDSSEKLVELREWASDVLPKFKSTIQPRLEKIMSELRPDYRETTE
ncbi:MAG: DUF4268 domain-containing protein [Chloroflexota bacterium]|nr:DUF4268 domain-containing protein [Chloroflexota bacterium]MDE2959708.1 DUF4268 domain-containing protein [Chloroflexota bacterium]